MSFWPNVFVFIPLGVYQTNFKLLVSLQMFNPVFDASRPSAPPKKLDSYVPNDAKNFMANVITWQAID